MHFVSRASLLAVVLIAAQAWAQNPWGEVKAPSAGEAEAIGGYAAGCVAGAVALPLTGGGFQVMRPSRNRFYGHPTLVAFVERLAARAERQGLGRLLIGDLSQPRGGPAAFGHASHQSGLDVDVWFRLLPKQAAPLRPEQTEQMAMESVVRAADGTLDKQRWDRRYTDLLRLAASAPEVDRIFVNPVIKRALCQAGERGDWLGKLRPWWGHDQHFHVRLTCPADSPGCEPQKAIPAGDGCDEDLDGWVREIQLAAKRPKPTPPDRSKTRLPLACDTVLAAASAPAGGGRTVIGARSGKADQRRLADQETGGSTGRN
jgi:penicillin-insensitive murein endopeptidase